MRKIYIVVSLFLCFMVTGCNTAINSSIYISSIGFEVKDEKVVAYFLSNPLTDITRSSEDKQKEAQFVKIEANSIYDAFTNAKQTLLSPLNFLHIKTVIFTEECFNSKYIE